MYRKLRTYIVSPGVIDNLQVQQLTGCNTHTHTLLYVFKCIFENICDDPLEFAFLWHVTRFVIFLWRSVRRVGAAQNANCTHTYVNTY